MRQDHIASGIFLMLLFCLLAPLLDVSAKLAAEGGIPVGEITAARFLVQGALMVPVVLIAGVGLAMRPRAFLLTLLRAICLMVSTFSFVAGIKVMAIADALAISFIEPFVLLILGAFIFGDKVGPRRIMACVVGFGGALLVIQPSLAAFGAVALWPLGTAFGFAFYMIITRALSAQMHPIAMQFHTSWLGGALSLAILALFYGGPITELSAVQPQGMQWIWLFGVGFWACLSHMSMTYALSFAPASTLAPLHYSEIVVAVILGYLIFDDLPDRLALCGIAVIISSGLYIIYRERQVARAGRALREPQAAADAAG